MRVSVLRTHAVGTPEAIPSTEDPETGETTPFQQIPFLRERTIATTEFAWRIADQTRPNGLALTRFHSLVHGKVIGWLEPDGCERGGEVRQKREWREWDEISLHPWE